MKTIKVLALLGLMLFVDFVSAEEQGFLDLITILRDDGAITEQQYERLSKVAKEGEGIEHSLVDVQVKTEGGLEISTYDGSASFELGGRLMVDAAYYDEDQNNLGSGTELRRARIELEGTLFSDWGYELGVDFAGGDADVKDAYIQYAGFWPVIGNIGQFKEPFSLEELTSSKYITFMERALPNEFAPGRSIGLGVRTRGEAWTAAAGLFGEAFDDDPKEEGDEGWAVTGRLTYAPRREDTRALHFGVAASYREPNDSDEVDFNARPESHLTDVKYVDTGNIDNTDSLVRYGLEAAGVYGPLSLQGEYINANVNRKSGSEDINFDGWYVFGSWFLTGESRPYKIKKGSFGRVKPRASSGAWELALRYSVLDLSDGPIRGGKEENITLGLNWYVNPHVRFMANYIIVNNDNDANADGDAQGDDKPNVLQIRAQLDF